MSRDTDAATRLARALEKHARLAGCPVEIVQSDWQAWASATFTGARHQMTLAAIPSAKLERWLATLSEADIDLRGHLLADIAIIAARRGPARVEIDLEALTVGDN